MSPLFMTLTCYFNESTGLQMLSWGQAGESIGHIRRMLWRQWEDWGSNDDSADQRTTRLRLSSLLHLAPHCSWRHLRRDIRHLDDGPKVIHVGSMESHVGCLLRCYKKLTAACTFYDTTLWWTYYPIAFG